MTVLTLYRCLDGWNGFNCKGHSGYAVQGEDIVCASVSAVTQYIACYCLQYLPDINVIIDEDSTLIECKTSAFSLDFHRQVSILHDIAKSIESQYKKYFNLKILEVK